MFNALRQGTLLYVLEKSSKPELKIGQVQSLSAPMPKLSQSYSMIPEATIDVSVEFDDGTISDFKQVPTSLSVASFGNVVISDSKETMIQEVDSMVRCSKQILGNIQYHKDVVNNGEKIMRMLNPTFAKEKETEERLTSLETGLVDIKEMLVKALNNSKSKKNEND